MELKQTRSKWLWMMDYCKKKRIPPEDKSCWNEAEKEYQKQNEVNPELLNNG